MTSKALAKRASGLQRLAEGLEIQNGELVPNPAFIEALRLAVQLEEDLKGFWGSIKTTMEVHKIDESKGDWGYLKLGPQRKLYAGKDVKPRFLTTAVNTKVVRAYQELHNGQLPAGITETVSTRLTKKVTE